MRCYSCLLSLSRLVEILRRHLVSRPHRSRSWIAGRRYCSGLVGFGGDSDLSISPSIVNNTSASSFGLSGHCPFFSRSVSEQTNSCLPVTGVVHLRTLFSGTGVHPSWGPVRGSVSYRDEDVFDLSQRMKMFSTVISYWWSRHSCLILLSPVGVRSGE